MIAKHLHTLCLLVLAACLGMALNSCTNDLPEPQQQPEAPGTDADNPLRPEDYVGQPVSFSGFTVTEVKTDAATRDVTRSESKPFGKEGDVVTIRMEVWDGNGIAQRIDLADYVLSSDGTSWVPAPQNEPLRWQGVDEPHFFTAYYPALTGQDREDKHRTAISLPLNWTEDDYRECGSLMQSPETGFDIGTPVSFSLLPLLTRIEVFIDPATGITDATHLTMYTKTEGKVGSSGATVPSIGATVQPMNLWRSTSPADATSGTPAGTSSSSNTVFRGYAIPQTYAPGTLLLKHHTPGVNDARNYTVDANPAYPKGLVTKGGEIVSFTVAAIVPATVNVPAAGGLEAALDAAYSTGDYPTRLKITGELNVYDIRYLVSLTRPAAAGSNIISVDMEGASATEEAFVLPAGSIPFHSYNGSIKSLVLPSSLRTVRLAAFERSTLTSVTLPKELTTIGMNAFLNCLHLQQVALSGDQSITVGTNAFFNLHPSCHLFLYAPGLDAAGTSIQEYLSGNWAGGKWANVHWGYKGSGSKLDPENYEHHKHPTP